MTAKILVVYECADGGSRTAEVLEAGGYMVRSAEATVEAIALACEFKPDLVVLDLDEKEGWGIQIARTISWVHGIPLLVLTDLASTEEARRVGEEFADDPHVADVLRKPLPGLWVVRAADEALEERTARPRRRVRV